MPVEIREFIIRTSVDKQNKTRNSPSSREDCSSPSPAINDQVQANEVLKMIKDQNER